MAIKAGKLQAKLLGIAGISEDFVNKDSMKWISITERLPPECESVLIWTKGQSPTSAYLLFTQKGEPICFQVNDWDESDSTISFKDVTYWMPLPEPPLDWQNTSNPNFCQT